MSSERLVRPGEELFLRYGDHCNRILFAEYGFVDKQAPAEVHVLDIVKEIVFKKDNPGKRLQLLDAENHLRCDD